METSIFDEKTQIPDDSGLTLALGAKKDLWDQLDTYIFENHGAVKKEWKFYSKKSGWTLVFKSKDYFKVLFVLGEKAVNAAKAAALPQQIVKKLLSSTPYAEGTSFDIDIKSQQDIHSAAVLLKIKLNM